MHMNNVNVLIKPDETQLDIVAEICDECDIGPDEPFAFSAIITPNSADTYKLKINCITPAEENPYTPTSLVSYLYHQDATLGVRYVQPPLEQWLQIFRPLLLRMVSRAHPRYERLIPDREELVSILHYAIVKLYNSGYYLHKTLVYKTFINELNMECRKLKGLCSVDSLDAPIGEDDDGKELTLLDQIADTTNCAWDYTDDDYRHMMFKKIKARMLEDMSEFQFERILIQLKSGTVDRNTSYKLDKYRQIFNPGYAPRPTAKGQPKGGRKNDK